MRKAEAMAEAEDIQFCLILEELCALHKNLPLESYLLTLEKFVDDAREAISAIADPDEQERQRERYRRVIEIAVDMACVAPS